MLILPSAVGYRFRAICTVRGQDLHLVDDWIMFPAIRRYKNWDKPRLTALLPIKSSLKLFALNKF